MSSLYEGFDHMPIAGAWRRGRSGALVSDRDPYTGEVLAEISLADATDVDDAYRAAARIQPSWAATPASGRRAVLEHAAHLIERRREEIIRWLIRESGSVRAKAELEWRLAHHGLLEASSYPTQLGGKILPADVPGKENRIYRRAVGVVGVISPWNFPFHLSLRAVGPALATGNAVVLKPASETPITGGLLIARLFEEAGLPPAVLNVVVGAGRVIGDAFIDHPIPRAISFTGSTEVGRRIAERAGRGIKRLCLELGGNTPFIVFDDADLERALDAAIAGKFLHAGQICIAINRFLVHAARHDEFLARFCARVAALKVGDPADPDTAIGPIINRTQLERVLRKVVATIAHGARAILRGEPVGLILPPIVLAEVTNDMAVAREEVFGPVAPFLRFVDEADAIRLANDTSYGLSSAVFTRDAERGLRVARRLETGMTHVNDWPVNEEPGAAFGGEKASGLGRFGGEWGLHEFTTHHWISVQEQPRRYPI
ncbi:MAG TPA: aldehyde dehydrogenase family protein [Kofleriaceae bacterium]|jgi:aldehyde dehydrogenase (NAD+)|nr:aldehyde dehydrogenase family protein [Kofleriaceae bacterium]